MRDDLNARLVAFYLPQFHPIPENDAWWGSGFTEWTNVARARPMFRGHYQPRLPADLGFYDLRVAEARAAQAELARAAGIEGFAYYHYWFGGKRLLERPFAEVVASGEPDFPFCLCWANQTWSGIWHGAADRILIEQTYPGKEDNEQHFLALLNAFQDQRYMRVDGKPIFTIFRPQEMHGGQELLDQWRHLAAKNGLGDMYFVAHVFPHEVTWDYRASGFDGAVVVSDLNAVAWKARRISYRYWRQRGGAVGGEALRFQPMVRCAGNRLYQRLRRAMGGFPVVIRYEEAMSSFLDWEGRSEPNMYPCVIPNWDNTPRSGDRGIVLHDSTPELFAAHLGEAISMVADRGRQHRLVFVKSWNEWAEGNYLEPDARFGHEYLRVVRAAVCGNPQV